LVILFFGCQDDTPQIPDFGEDDIILYTRWPFPVGVAVPGSRTSNVGGGIDNALITTNPQHRLLRHFNVVVAENEMKPDNILPASRPDADPSEWTINMFNWEPADALVTYAEANGKRIRGHTLIWHAQTPAWFFQGSGNSGRATIEELYARMENYIRIVFTKYGNRIDTWDVCNEVVDHTAGGPRTDSLYTQIMIDAGKTNMDRYEYVLRAFEWARHYSDLHTPQGEPSVQLYLTDFGIERRFPGQSRSKIDDFEDLVNWLILNNAPIDGVGFQGHFRLYDHPVEQISAGIDRFSNIIRSDGVNLMVQVCELDFSIFSGEKGEINALTVSSNILPQRLEDLAATYLSFFQMFEEKYNEGRLNMVLIWGITDGHSWLNSHPLSGRIDHPLLFNRSYRPKQAYRMLVDGRPEF
jgi:endo-1,4-beta-xylanase